MKKILVLGAGGHAKVVVDLARKAAFDVVGILDDFRQLGTDFCGAKILGKFSDLPDVCKQKKVSSGVIAIGDNHARSLVAQQILTFMPSFSFVSLIHPSATIGSDVSVGVGSVVMAGVVINPATQIGKHVILNTKSSVDHDGIIGDFASLAPGATLGGTVSVGSYSAVGLGANVIHGVSIGAHTVIGAGSLINKAIPELVVAYGVPARVVRSRKAGEKYL